MMRSRPVAMRMRWIALIVASVPELQKRHNGRWKRRASSRATMIVSPVGCAKCVPSVDALLHRADDGGVRVADEHRAEAGVQVDVLVAVDVERPWSRDRG